MEKIIEDNKKIFIAKTVKEVKMIFDPIRFRIIRTIHENEKEMTVKEIAVAMEEAANKIHYHVTKLFKFGALKLVRTENINGIIAKYYTLAYYGFVLDPEGESQQVYDLTKNALYKSLDEAVDKFKSDMVSYMNLIADQGESAKRGLEVGYYNLYMTKEEKVELSKELHDLVHKYRKKDPNKEVYTSIQTLARIK